MLRSTWQFKLPANLLHWGGQTVTWSRTNLDPTNVHMLVYYKDNLPLVNIPKLRLEDNEEKELEEECHAEMETGTDSDDD